MKRPLALLVSIPFLCLAFRPAGAFCGFYVGKADSGIFNRASKVVLVHDADRTVITMASDFRGDLREFALVVPVPTFVTREQIHVAERALLEHLDAYSAPRLVEYFDEDPCRRLEAADRMLSMGYAAAPRAAGARERDKKSLGVTVEAEYTVGEYDILILSAKESSGLETWLRQSGYKIPRGASSVLGSYIAQGMRFFVAKVNVKEQAKTGYSYLRPIQVAYESPRFMVPIRLGTVNADGPQDLFVFALTRNGRVETTNYRTVKLPTGMDLPVFLKSKDAFAKFYTDLFTEQVRKEGMRAVFLEYAWDMGWCDPCAADPLAREELGELGVFWLDEAAVVPGFRRQSPGGPQNVFLTRLHVRYDRDHFPEDLVFQETADRENFQGRYVLRHSWEGGSTCPAAEEYRNSLQPRFEREAKALASLTGWSLAEIWKKMSLEGPVPVSKNGGDPWWKRLWR